MNKLDPIHPGEILNEEFLKPLNITVESLSADLNVARDLINNVINKKTNISVELALRLSRYFDLSERFWINLQSRYDLEIEKDRLKDKLIHEVKVLKK